MNRVLLAAAVVLAALVGYVLITHRAYETSSGNPPVASPAPSAPTLTVPLPPLREDDEPRTYVVLMNSVGGRFMFQPAGLYVRPGDTVIWFNLGDNHSTTAYAPPNEKAGGVAVPARIPEGAQAWDSGILGIQNRGLTFSYTFQVPGTYDYFCFPHEFLGMVGRIVVGVPGGPAETAGTAGLSDEAAAVLQGLSSELIAGPRGATFNLEAELNAVLLAIFEENFEEAVARARRLRDGVPSLAGLLGPQTEAFSALVDEVLAGAQNRAGFGEIAGKIDEARELLARVRG